MFPNGGKFRDSLFAYLEDKVFPKWGLFLKERISSHVSSFFHYELTPIYVAGKKENDRVASPENVPIYFDLGELRMIISYYLT